MTAVWVRAEATSPTNPLNPLMGMGVLAALVAVLASSPSSLRPQEYTNAVLMVIGDLS